ncbi:MAG: carboxypeptidase regulatory-like domain-containing protein [Candidatus Poribacteria bacterium]|nr:carboxypeptidase regulatory-like domain-containing protein [Candidatus Poribacteria bacterium]
MILKKNILLLLLLACIFACGEAEETTEPEEPVVIEYGAVSGSITDAGTGNRIPGSTVTLLEQSIETGVDGAYAFQGVPYGDTHTLIVSDPDYKPYSQPITLNQQRLVVDIMLTPLRDPVEEIQEFFDNFADLLESVDMKNIEAIEALFSETYVAADDPATLFGVASGIIPENYADVVPAMTQLFEEYVSLQFLFQDMEMDITHARKAAVTLQLDINAEKGEDLDLRELKARCQFEFRREGPDLKIVHWQLFELDVRL